MCVIFSLEPNQLWEGKEAQGMPMPFQWEYSLIAKELPNDNETILPLPEGVTTALEQSNKANKMDKQEMWRSSAKISSM